MKRNRLIAFGYCMVDGKLRIQPQEAEVVQEVYRLYLDGLGYGRIAERLNDKGIPYHESNPSWDKRKVQRLLQNERYTGTDGYEPIIGAEAFQAAQTQTQERRNYEPVGETVAQSAKNKLYCTCNLRLSPRPNSRWACPKCGMKVTDADLCGLIGKAIDRLESNVKAIEQYEAPEAYEPTMEIRQLSTEIRRTIGDGDYDAAELKRKIMQCAKMRYEAIEPDVTPYIRLTIAADGGKAADDVAAQIELVRKTFATITYIQPAAIRVTLKNGAAVTIEGEANHGN